MVIDAKINDVIVTIDGEDYPCAPATIAVMERIDNIEQQYQQKHEYEKWLAMLEVVLGRDAVRKIFPNGKNENIYRLEMIFNGVMDAFSYDRKQLERERNDKVLEELKGFAPMLDLMDKYPKITKSK